MTSNDTLRVGDRAVPLAEVMAEHGSGFAPRDSAPIVRALVVEVRRLRAVESAGTLVAVELCACGFIRSLHGSNNILPHAFTLKETYYTRTWTVPAAAPPETGG